MAAPANFRLFNPFSAVARRLRAMRRDLDDSSVYLLGVTSAALVGSAIALGVGTHVHIGLSHPDVMSNPVHRNLPHIRDSTKNHAVPSLNLHADPMYLTEDEMELLENPNKVPSQDDDLPELQLTQNARRYAGGGSIRGPLMQWMHEKEHWAIGKNPGNHSAGGGAQF